jgi:hypothetical protein
LAFLTSVSVSTFFIMTVSGGMVQGHTVKTTVFSVGCHRF